MACTAYRAEGGEVTAVVTILFGYSSEVNREGTCIQEHAVATIARALDRRQRRNRRSARAPRGDSGAGGR